jgi:hypothetical protein
MAKDKEPNSGSVARSKRIHEQIDQLRKKRSKGAPTSGEPPRRRARRAAAQPARHHSRSDGETRQEKGELDKILS